MPDLLRLTELNHFVKTRIFSKLNNIGSRFLHNDSKDHAMKLKTRLILAVILILSLTVFFWFHIHFTHQLPAYTGTLEINGLNTPVDVYTDDYGVPHVFANNEDDLLFAAGYVVARERLFQLSVISAAVNGELSMLFGPDLLSSDIYLRTWGIPEIAQKLADAMDPEIREKVQIYCNGINQYIKDSEDDPPLELRILGKKAPLWTPATVCGYTRLMAHDLQQSWKPEILFGAVEENYGTDMLKQLLPPYPKDYPTIAGSVPPGFTSVFAAVQKSEKKVREFTGANGKGIGSNNWVVSGSRTRSGKPLLANDPHLGFTQPAKWYEMHLKGGDIDVSGVCLPGMPLPVIGQNASCAWGFTNVMVDDIDFFTETTDPERPNQYLVDGEWKNMTLRKEIIPLPDGKDSTIVVRETVHGPVISDLHTMLKKGNAVVSMCWTGREITYELEAMFGFAKMHNWSDFSEAVKKFSVPGQNIVWADTAGNIGWRPAVIIPIRKNGSSLLPRDGSDSQWDWKGYVPFDEMPYLFNPPEGAIATANNKTVDDDYPYYISNLWTDPSRAIRIKELLGNRTGLTVRDMENIQTDVVSVYAKEMVPKWLPLLPEPTNEPEKAAIDFLKKWDGAESADSPATLVFQAMLRQCMIHVYKDELDAIGPDAFAAYLDLPMIPLRNLQWTMEADSSNWIDNILTPDYKETREDIVTAAFHDAMKDIGQRVGTSPGSWSWGAVHTLSHPHSMGSVSLLNWLFKLNVGPFPNGGSSTTINNGEYRLLNPYQQVLGPSMRRIVNFDNLNKTQMILPTGESGLPGSPHYADQAQMYISGQYRTTWFDENSIKSMNMDHLLLIPEK